MHATSSTIRLFLYFKKTNININYKFGRAKRASKRRDWINFTLFFNCFYLRGKVFFATKWKNEPVIASLRRWTLKKRILSEKNNKQKQYYRLITDRSMWDCRAYSMRSMTNSMHLRPMITTMTMMTNYVVVIWEYTYSIQNRRSKKTLRRCNRSVCSRIRSHQQLDIIAKHKRVA